MTPAIGRLGRQALKALRLGRRFTMQELVDAVTIHRGRAIKTLPIPGAIQDVMACYLTMSDMPYDVIMYRGDQPHWYQQHLIAHEIGHIILGHVGNPLGAAESAQVQDADGGVSKPAMTNALARCGFDSLQESQAEVLAHVFTARLISEPMPELAAVEREAVVRRFDLALAGL